ncbi:MAG: hypothetical protein FWG37_03665, partial [Clostridia bacterium]|nr:hypothetical protein [Clostridia bacterium]
MIKTVALSTVLFLTLVLYRASAPIVTEADDITGTWHFYSIEVEGMAFNPASLGMEASMTLSKDNTVILQSAAEEDRVGIWAMDGGRIVISTDDASKSYAASGGFLITEEFGVRLLYGREQPVAKPAELPPIRAVSTFGDFNGTWTGCAFYTDGVMAPLSLALIFDASLAIKDGKVVCAIASDELFRDDYEGVLEGGLLIAESRSDPAGDMGTLTLSMREDNTLSAHFPD